MTGLKHKNINDSEKTNRGKKIKEREKKSMD